MTCISNGVSHFGARFVNGAIVHVDGGRSALGPRSRGGLIAPGE
jgi:hypothetical protein